MADNQILRRGAVHSVEQTFRVLLPGTGQVQDSMVEEWKRGEVSYFNKTSTGWPEERFMGPCEPRKQKQIYFCFLCNGPGTSKHHLVPKQVRQYRGTTANLIVRTCRKCHNDIHYYFSNWELATKFNSEERLRNELPVRREIAKLFLQ